MDEGALRRQTILIRSKWLRIGLVEEQSSTTSSHEANTTRTVSNSKIFSTYHGKSNSWHKSRDNDQVVGEGSGISKVDDLKEGWRTIDGVKIGVTVLENKKKGERIWATKISWTLILN